VEVSARMYNDSNSLGDRAKEGRGGKGRHAGTGEGISASIHVANSHADRAEDRRRSDCRHSANSLWERVDSCMTVGASIVVVDAVGRGEGVSHYRSEGFNRGWKVITYIKNRTARACTQVGVTPLTAPTGRYTNWDFCHV